MIQHLVKLVLVGGIVGGCSFFIPENGGGIEFEDTKICPGGAVVIRNSAEEPFPPCPDVDNSISYDRFLSEEVEDTDEAFTFFAEIPSHWVVEAVTENNSLNIYDPLVDADSSLEQSMIFVRFFESDDFETLDTVTIHSEDTSDILDRPTVVYDIEKNDNIPDFANQPSWRNTRHSVIDVRESDDDPSIFYVFALNPEIPLEVFEHFLYSLVFDTDDMVHVEFPIDDFFGRITKKPFGIFITPEDSPVQPERFTGYHTGVDIEYDDVVRDVPVRAIADGEVVLSRFADGYGGVAVIEHTLADKTFFSLYGHLDPTSMKDFAVSVDAGEQIGILGDHESNETDGERKHLHFAIYQGDEIHLQGYVDTEDELKGWINPEGFFDMIR